MATEYSNASVTVMCDDMVFISIGKRSTFDALPFPVETGAKCLAKSHREIGKFWIIFQFWGER
jgi:hypothetical protein